MSALDKLNHAQELAAKMRQAAETEDWEQMPVLDQQVREAFDAALALYSNAGEEEQRSFRTLGGELLTDHRATLEAAEARLTELKSEVSGLLKSGKVAKSYSANS